MRSLRGEGIEASEGRVLVDGDVGLFLGLCLRDIDVDERLLTIKGQTGTEALDSWVVAAVAADNVVDLEVYRVGLWVGDFHAGHLNGGCIDLMLCLLWKANEYQWQYDDQNDDDQNETVYFRLILCAKLT